MTAWMIAGAAVAALLAVVLVAVFVDEQSERRGRPSPEMDDLGPRIPLRRVPDPDEVGRIALPRAWRGYDPVAVDGVLARLGRAYAALWAESDDETRRRAAARINRHPGSGAPPVPDDAMSGEELE